MTTTVVNRKHRPFDIYIGRGSQWGNPFTHLPIFRDGITIVGSREESIERYAEWLQEQPSLLAQIPALKGKVLGCYCSPLPCHGDVLAALADAS